MMENREKYTGKIKHISLENIIATLSDADLSALFEDILTGNVQGLETKFKTSRWSATTQEAAYDWLAELDLTKPKIERALEPVYEKAVHNKFKNSDQVLKNIQAIVAVKKAGLSRDFLVALAKKEMDPVTRAKIYLLVSMLANDPARDDFGKSFITHELRAYPYLCVAYVCFHKKRKTLKSFDILHHRYVDDDEEAFNDEIAGMLKSQLETALYFALENVKGNSRLIEKKLIHSARQIKSYKIRNILAAAIKDPYFEKQHNAFKTEFERNLEIGPVLNLFTKKIYSKSKKIAGVPGMEFIDKLALQLSL